MAKALVFINEREAMLLNAKEGPGYVEVEELPLKWITEKQKQQPFLLKNVGIFKKTEPLYIVKWDSVFPAKLQFKTLLKKNKEGKKVILQTVNIVTTRYEKHTPEIVKKVTSLQILGNMIKAKKKVKIGGALIGLIIGAIVTYMLFVLKILKVR